MRGLQPIELCSSRVVAVSTLLLLMAGCLGEVSDPATDPLRLEPETETETETAPTEALDTRALRRAVLEARMAEAGPLHDWRVAAVGAETWIARPPHHDLRVALDAEAVSFTPRDVEKGWQADLRLAGVGARGATRPLSAGTTKVVGNRLEIARGGGVTEWWVHGPPGLEQGFTLDRPIPGATTEVEISVETSGELTPSLVAAGTAVSLVDDTGMARLRITDLFAHDARGRDLPVRFEVEGRSVRMIVGVGGAEYPVAVDPLYREAEISAFDAEENDWFGAAIDSDGSRLVVGAPQDDDRA